MERSKTFERAKPTRDILAPEVDGSGDAITKELQAAIQGKKPPKPHKKVKKAAEDSGKNVNTNNNEADSTGNSRTSDDRIPSFDLSKWLLKENTYGLNNSVLHILNNRIYEPMTIDKFGNSIRRGVHMGQLPVEAEKSINRYYLQELLEWVSASPSIPELPEVPDQRYIALANGLFDVKKGRIVDDDDKDFIDGYPVLYNRLPVSYKEDYTVYEWEHSYSLAFLRRFAHPDCQKECVDHCKYLFGKTASNDRSGKIMTHFYGPTDSGKSVCADIIQGMLGKANYSNMGLSSLSKNFSLINLYHKLANISSDESLAAWTMDVATNIKLITSGDMVTADVKFQTPVQFRPYASLICFGNDAPVISHQIDAGNAVTKRLNLIPTGPTVKDKISGFFKEYIKPELDLLFSVSIDFFCNNEMPAKIIPLDEFASSEISQPALFELWCEQCVSKTEEESVSKVGETIWPCYKYFAETAPYSSRLSQKQFEMKFAVKYQHNKAPGKVNGVSAYHGLKFENRKYNPKEPAKAKTRDYGEW